MTHPLVNRARMRHRNELRWAKLGTGSRNFRRELGNGVHNSEDEDDLGDGPGEWRERNPTPAELFDDDE